MHRPRRGRGRDLGRTRIRNWSVGGSALGVEPVHGPDNGPTGLETWLWYSDPSQVGRDRGDLGRTGHRDWDGDDRHGVCEHVVEFSCDLQPLLFNQPSRLPFPLTLLLDVLSSAFGTDRATRSNRITERDHRSQQRHRHRQLVVPPDHRHRARPTPSLNSVCHDRAHALWSRSADLSSFACGAADAGGCSRHRPNSSSWRPRCPG